LKESIAGAINAELKPKKESVRVAPAAPVRRVSWGTFARAAAGVILLVGVTGATALLRGPSPEDVRRHYREAQGDGTLAVVAHSYELVVKTGIDKPECRTEVDDSLLQLQAIHQFEYAMGQPKEDAKVAQLRDCVQRFPTARVTQLALAKLSELAPPAANESVPLPPSKSGFEGPGEYRFYVDKTAIQRYTEDLENQFIALKDIADENLRKKQEAEVRTQLAVRHMQWAQSESQDRELALRHYKRAREVAEPNSLAAREAQKHVDQLSR